MAQKALLKTDIQFYREMGEIIETLRGVAATEYFRLQKIRERFDEFEGRIENFFRMIKIDGLRHPFLDDVSPAKQFVLITSDAGFLGKLNVEVVGSALERHNPGDRLVVVGKQGDRYLSAENIEGDVDNFPGISDNISWEEVGRLRDHIIDGLLEEKVGATEIIYPHFISFGVQKVQRFQMLPCGFLFGQEDAGESPAAGNAIEDELEEEIILEPSSREIVESLVRTWAGQLLLGIFWESKLSEWAARVMRLEQSSMEIKKVSKELKHQYFRVVHELSDKGIREIFASSLALGRNK